MSRSTPMLISSTFRVWTDGGLKLCGAWWGISCAERTPSSWSLLSLERLLDAALARLARLTTCVRPAATRKLRRQLSRCSTPPRWPLALKFRRQLLRQEAAQPPRVRQERSLPRRPAATLRRLRREWGQFLPPRHSQRHQRRPQGRRPRCSQPRSSQRTNPCQPRRSLRHRHHSLSRLSHRSRLGRLSQHHRIPAARQSGRLRSSASASPSTAFTTRRSSS